MKRWLTCMAALGALVAGPRPAGAELYYGFTIGISNAPPPPVIRYSREPECVRASDAMVYVVEDDDFRYNGDLFRYGQYWFAYQGGYWYRGRSFRGPFSVIDVRRVPRAVIYVPKKHWKHHPHGGPPGQMRRTAVASRRPDVVVVRERRPVVVRERRPVVVVKERGDTHGSTRYKDDDHRDGHKDGGRGKGHH